MRRNSFDWTSVYPNATDEEIEAFAAMGPIQAVKYSVLNLKLLKACQEAQARIEALEVKVSPSAQNVRMPPGP